MRQKTSLWKLTPWNKRSLGSESKSEWTQQTEEWGYRNRPEHEHKGLQAPWLALPTLSVCRLSSETSWQQAPPSSPCPWTPLLAVLQGRKLIQLTRRHSLHPNDASVEMSAEAVLALIDAFCGTLESKILGSILDQPSLSPLCGQRFMASLSHSVFLALCIRSGSNCPHFQLWRYFPPRLRLKDRQWL